MKVKNILLSILVIALVIVLEGIVMGYYQKTIEVVNNPVVTMQLEDYGTVTIELYPDKAPNTVANFIKLINDGFYNGSTFHRAIEGALIQGGAANGDVSTDDKFAIKGEFFANDFKLNNVRHEPGVISMARSDYGALSASLTEEGYNSASTQFFIMDETNRNFDGLYCGFGKVISGLDIVDKITKLEKTTDDNGGTTKNLETPVKISQMTVDTFGFNYGEPERNTTFDYYSWFMKNYTVSN